MQLQRSAKNKVPRFMDHGVLFSHYRRSVPVATSQRVAIANESLLVCRFQQRKLVSRGATTCSKLGVQFLGLGYYYPSTEKKQTSLPSLVSRLHNHTLFIKKIGSWGIRPNFGEVRTPRPSSGCAHVGLCQFQNIFT